MYRAAIQVPNITEMPGVWINKMQCAKTTHNEQIRTSRSNDGSIIYMRTILWMSFPNIIYHTVGYGIREYKCTEITSTQMAKCFDRVVRL